jgi:type VI protein secretion system component VasF
VQDTNGKRQTSNGKKRQETRNKEQGTRVDELISAAANLNFFSNPLKKNCVLGNSQLLIAHCPLIAIIAKWHHTIKNKNVFSGFLY